MEEIFVWFGLIFFVYGSFFIVLEQVGFDLRKRAIEKEYEVMMEELEELEELCRKGAERAQKGLGENYETGTISSE